MSDGKQVKFVLTTNGSANGIAGQQPATPTTEPVRKSSHLTSWTKSLTHQRANTDPLYLTCCCLHVRSVTISLGYTVTAAMLVSNVFFISVAQQAHLSPLESKAIIAGMCLGTLVGVSLATALLYGAMYEKPMLMIPYLVVFSTLFVVSLVALVWLALAIAYGMDKQWEHWAEEHIWHEHMRGLTIAKFSLFILAFIQGWALTVKWRCFLHFIQNKRRQAMLLNNNNQQEDNT